MTGLYTYGLDKQQGSRCFPGKAVSRCRLAPQRIALACPALLHTLQNAHGTSHQ